MKISALEHDCKFEKGTYVLILKVVCAQRLTVGHLGTFIVPEGYYCYVGSALGTGGLKARIRHHLESDAQPRWHIDYLSRIAVPVEVWFVSDGKRLEHTWAAALSGMLTAVKPAIKGFGSSDCRCETHLFHSKRLPSIREFSRKIASKVRRCPAHMP